LKGDTKDIARECIGWHVANVVRAKKCGEMVCCSTDVLHVVMALGWFNVILNAKNSNPWWVQCDKACKIEVQLDLDKLNMLLAANGDGPILNWQMNGQIGSGGHIIHLLTRFIMKQQNGELGKVRPVVPKVAVPIAKDGVDNGAQVELGAKSVKHQ
jgi:hypothetical protein